MPRTIGERIKGFFKTIVWLVLTIVLIVFAWPLIRPILPGGGGGSSAPVGYQAGAARSKLTPFMRERGVEVMGAGGAVIKLRWPEGDPGRAADALRAARTKKLIRSYSPRGKTDIRTYDGSRYHVAEYTIQ